MILQYKMSLPLLKDRLQFHGGNQGGCFESILRSLYFSTDTVQTKQRSIANITSFSDINLSAVVRMNSSLAEIQMLCGGNARQRLTPISQACIPASVKAMHGSPSRGQTRNVKPDQIRMAQSANVLQTAQSSSYSLDRYVNSPPERYEKLVTRGGSCDQTVVLSAEEVSKTKPAKRKA
ncbi:hypothetical protein BST61_g3024 [Cercospora zeina]